MELEMCNSARSISLCEPTPSQSPIGRTMGVLLATRHSHLDSAIRRVGVAPSRSDSASLLDESLCFLWRHVDGAVGSGEGLVEVLVPMIEHSLSFKESKHSKQVASLLAWLHSEERFSLAISSCLVEILKKKEDHFIALGWCKLVTMMVELLFDRKLENKKHGKEGSWLKILWQSIPHLCCIIRRGSTLIDGFELPTRLAAASADCMLVLFEALMRISTGFSSSTSEKLITDLSEEHGTSSQHSPSVGKDCPLGQGTSKHIVNLDFGYLFWNNLDDLVILIEKLKDWSKKSQPLHAGGLDYLCKWLRDTKLHYDSFGNQDRDEMIKHGILLLCSCWKHYGRLMRINDAKFVSDRNDILESLLGALQFYSNQDAALSGEVDGGLETRRFLLNCLVLLLGRLHGKHLQAAISRYADGLLPLLFVQLQDNDEDLAEGSVGIIRRILFARDLSTADLLLNAHQMENLFSILLKFLNEHNPAAIAVVQLAAECCTVFPNGQGLEKIFRCFDEGSGFQKSNAIEVVSAICLNSGHTLPVAARKETAMFLVKSLQAGLVSRYINIHELFSRLDASIFPELLHLICSKDEKVKSLASDALIAMLTSDCKDFSLFFLMIDCISNKTQFSASSFDSVSSMSGLKLDVDQVICLLLKSSEIITDKTQLINKLIDRFFFDPSDVIIVRLLSHFSGILAKLSDLVFHRVLVYMDSEKELDKKVSSINSAENNLLNKNDSLFSRLSPLLLLRVLPLSAYDDPSSLDLYGHVNDPNAAKDPNVAEYIYKHADNCIAGILFDRAFSPCEFEEVRKLSAELCGRLHAKVLLPVVAYHLESAVKKQDILKIKACLFSLCTSLVVRGIASSLEYHVFRILNAIDLVLSFPSFESDEVSKAQHGCIDCIALLICAESKCECSRQSANEECGLTSSIIKTVVIQRLLWDKISPFPFWSNNFFSKEVTASSIVQAGFAPNLSSILPFRLCMANVLISSYQKVSDSSKSLLCSQTLPALISGVEDLTEPEIRAACIQVLFSAVYNLKAIVLPFSLDLFKLAMKALKHGSEEEKVAATKLMASLMANDEILGCISGCLLEAKSILSHISSTSFSSELRKVCKQLLSCMVSPLHS